VSTLPEYDYLAWCNDCEYAWKIINKEDKSGDRTIMRWYLDQSLKQILNILLGFNYKLEDFCFCSKLGELRSLVAELECEHYEYSPEAEFSIR
jgi:hypothetical protein